MAKEKNKPEGLNQESLEHMTDDELLKTYFACGGYMVETGFTQPMPCSRETSAVCFSLEWLKTPSGSKLLKETHAAFRDGKIDQYGKPVKPVKVVRRKSKNKRKK